MKAIYTDLHIHTSENPNNINQNYDIELLLNNIKNFNNNSEFIISLTDHNTINKTAYLKAVELGVNILLGVELHIKNYTDCPAYHCHAYFNLEVLTEDCIDDINKKLDKLYPIKQVVNLDDKIPSIQDIINEFDSYDFILLPHGGQSHSTFHKSIGKNSRLDSTLEKNIYYNHFEGFTARGSSGLEATQEYFKRLGINEFVNLITCSDNYNPKNYPNGKDKTPFIPTWILAKPTFNGLRLSLSEKSRLVYSVDKPDIWAEKIHSVKHNTNNIEIDVDFTSGLNVIIGGSSSGKTLLVDSIYRQISQIQEGSVYSKYKINEMEINNPSKMLPHYLSQNYIMSVVNNLEDNTIENIDIIKKVFPGDDDVKKTINNGLAEFKKNIYELIDCVISVENEYQNIQKIPILSRLITKGNVEVNIFKNLLPKGDDNNNLIISDADYNEHLKNLDRIESFLSKYPFINHDSQLITGIREELNTAFNIHKKERTIYQIITTKKDKYDTILIKNNAEEQTKKQNFDNLIVCLKQFILSYRRFYKILDIISAYCIKIDTKEIISMGHKLYIENEFELNKTKFIEIINAFLKKPVDSYDNIKPSNFFKDNFKERPKVQGYDGFRSKVYTKFEELNKRKYKIITNDGRHFDQLSPGWKTSVILDIILGYDGDISPIIIDQPEDNLATTYINNGLVKAIKETKAKKQIILVSHNATIPMLADAQNIILCQNIDNKLIIKSSPLEGYIDGKSVVDYIAEITDGGKPSIKKRVKKYNLKKYTEQ